MPELVRITDVSPRDGLQNEPGVIPTPDKARLVELLCATGVDEVEVTSFVSPKWVPQLGDAKELLDALKAPSQREGVGGGFDGSGATREASGSRPALKAPSQREGVGGGFAGAGAPSEPPRSRRAAAQARDLRRRETDAESALWERLRNRRIEGVKFRRQHPVGSYIVDFYAPSHRLVVELDGPTHAGPEAIQADGQRTAYLNHFGYRVVRFTNHEALSNTDGVAETIRDYLRGNRSAPAGGSVGILTPHARFKPSPLPPPSGRGGRRPLYSALVPNERGMQGVLEALRRDPGCLSKVSVFTAASETFASKNTNASIAETLERFKPVVAAAHAEGLAVRGYVSCVIACPFEGPVPAAKVAEVSAQLGDLGVDELDLGDTIGAGTPDTIAAMLDAVDDEWPVRPPPELNEFERDLCTLHLHDTFGRAADCVKAALDLGVRSFDGSVAGLGGCPYASTPGRRAPGNIDTRLLVETIHHAGYTTNVDLNKLDEAAAFAREIVARARSTA